MRVGLPCVSLVLSLSPHQADTEKKTSDRESYSACAIFWLGARPVPAFWGPSILLVGPGRGFFDRSIVAALTPGTEAKRYQGGTHRSPFF